MRSISWYLLFLCMVTAAPAGASSALPDSGTRIRLGARVPERPAKNGNASEPGSARLVKAQFTGPFVSALRDTVMMRDAEKNHALVAVPTLHVTSFEISRGKLSNRGKGALIGFVIGGAMGLGLAMAAKDNYVAVGIAAVGISAFGAGIGAARGATHPTERWSKLPVEDVRSAARP